jgi:hypothetical protein
VFITITLGVVPIATATGALPLTISAIAAAGETLDGIRDEAVTSGRPVYRPVTVTTRFDDHHVDLGVRAENVDIAALPPDLDQLARTEPIAGLLADYREQITELAIRLAVHGFATANRVTAAFDLIDLRTLRQCLELAENNWREALTTAEAAAQQPRRDPAPATPGFMNVEPTPPGYHAMARHFDAELDRAQQFHRRFGRLLDLAQQPPADDEHRP